MSVLAKILASDPSAVAALRGQIRRLLRLADLRRRGHLSTKTWRRMRRAWA